MVNKPLTIIGGLEGFELNGKPQGEVLGSVLDGDIGPTSGDASYHVVTIQGTGGGKVVLDRFKVWHGSASTGGLGPPTTPDQRRGGGITIIQGAGAGVLLSRLHVTGNGAEDFGGNIYSSRSNLLIKQCTIGAGGATRGAGIYAQFSTIYMVNVVMGGNILSTTGQSGAGMHLNAGSLNAVNCTFVNNYASMLGSTGAAANLTGGVQALFTYCSFGLNTAASTTSIDGTTNLGVPFNLRNCASNDAPNCVVAFGASAFTASACVLPQAAPGPGAPAPNPLGLPVNYIWQENWDVHLQPLLPTPPPLLPLAPVIDFGSTLFVPADLLDIDDDGDFDELLPLDRELRPRTTSSPGGTTTSCGPFEIAIPGATSPQLP